MGILPSSHGALEWQWVAIIRSVRIPTAVASIPARRQERPQKQMGKRALRVPAWDDAFPIAVTAFAPEGDIYDSEKVVVLINGATGCFQYYYAAFATYFLPKVP
jgi:hypothetical protein